MKKPTAYLIAAVVGLLIIVGVSAVSQGQTPKAKAKLRDCNESRLSFDHACRFDSESRACLNEAYAANIKADCKGWERFLRQSDKRQARQRLISRGNKIDADAVLAQRFEPWYAQVLRLAPRYGYHIKADDESWREYFWLHHFLQGASPRKALIDSRRRHNRAN